MARDPVCGMEIEEQAAAATREVAGQTYAFCSDQCVKKFDADPAAYTKHESQGETATRVIGSATTGVNPNLSGPVHVELPIVDLICASCTQAIERALLALEGVQRASVNISTGKAHAVYDPARLSLVDLERAIRKAG